MNFVAEVFPQIVGDAAFAAQHAAARRAVSRATHRPDRLIDRQNDFGHHGFTGRLGQTIAAARTTHARRTAEDPAVRALGAGVLPVSGLIGLAGRTLRHRDFVALKSLADAAFLAPPIVLGKP